MLQQVIKKITFLAITVLTLIACKKEPVTQQPGPTPPQSYKFRLVMESLPGLPKQPVANLFARLEIRNEQNEVIKSNLLSAISFNQQFISEEIALPAGNYRITQLFLQSGTGTIMYAVPLAGSIKATAVTRPLSYSVILPRPVTLDVPAQFLKVEPDDKASDYGYPSELFPGSQPGNGLSIRVKTSIKIGSVLYDSIPSTLLYRKWLGDNDFQVRIISLRPGVNTVELDPSALKHDLIISKWGKDYTHTIRKEEIRNDALYLFGEEKEAKQLKAELVYIWTNNQYKAESKNNYIYNDKNHLTRIEYLRRRTTDNSPYIAMKEEFVHNNGRVDHIIRYDENNNISGSTSFGYNDNGQPNSITEQENGISKYVSVNYHTNQPGGYTEVNFRYTYSHNGNSMDYFQRYSNGNLESENSRSNNGNTETAVYDYDQNINPYIHMGWPNLYLSNNSKNNITYQQRSYYGNYPANVVYSYEYKYDEEGYPIELIRRYKSYTTGQHLFTTKTVFTY